MSIQKKYCANCGQETYSDVSAFENGGYQSRCSHCAAISVTSASLKPGFARIDVTDRQLKTPGPQVNDDMIHKAIAMSDHNELLCKATKLATQLSAASLYVKTKSDRDLIFAARDLIRELRDQLAVSPLREKKEQQ